MAAVITVLRQHLGATLIGYFLARLAAKGLGYVLAPNIYPELEVATGVSAQTIAALNGSVLMALVMGYAIPALERCPVNWRFLVAATTLVPVIALPLLYLGLSGLADPRIMLLVIPATIIGVLVLASQFLPQEAKKAG